MGGSLGAVLKDHPKVEVELDLSERYVDLVSKSYDLAIRIGDLPDSTLTARRLANSRRVVFAAPSYFAAHGRPRRPQELAHHQCIVRYAARNSNDWPFRIDGTTKAVKVAGRFRTNGAVAANEAAVQGLGIARAALWEVRPLLDRGAIELALTRFEPMPIPIQAVWPATRVLPAKTKLFVDFLAARLKNEQL